MKIRAHIFINEVCRVCGADSFPKLQRMYSSRGLAVPQEDSRTCLERDDHYGQQEMRPEPKRREYAFDDPSIGQRMKELEAERLATTSNVEPAPALEQEDPWMCGMYGQFPRKPTVDDKLLSLSEKSIG